MFEPNKKLKTKTYETHNKMMTKSINNKNIQNSRNIEKI